MTFISALEQCKIHSPQTVMNRLVSLCKRRGFVLPSADPYGGFRGAYDYGPLGHEMKLNIIRAWRRSMLYERDDVMTLDTPTMLPHKVWQASGHLSHFSDPLVDCLLSNARFRTDKASPLRVSHNNQVLISVTDPARAIQHLQQHIAPGIRVTSHTSALSLHLLSMRNPTADQHGELLFESTTASPISVPYRGYVSPCNSPFLTPERAFNLMFQTTQGALDPIDTILQRAKTHQSTPATLRQQITDDLSPHALYLRPETAQGTFLQYPALVDCLPRGERPMLPFGIAQIGKSYRNEITTEHFIFRTLEFEQMELEYFCHPAQSDAVFDDMTHERLSWYHRYANHPEHFSLRAHASTELSHYARACADIDYHFPFGNAEIEGIAHRGDFDLRQHSAAAEMTLNVIDAQQQPQRILPHIVEPSAGLNRVLLAFLCDAFETRPDKPDQTLLRLHPRLAPYKVAILPLCQQDTFLAISRRIYAQLRRREINCLYDIKHSIGKRYAKQDEIGTPFCITVDQQTLSDHTVTVRYRDSMHQERHPIDHLYSFLSQHDCT